MMTTEHSCLHKLSFLIEPKTKPVKLLETLTAVSRPLGGVVVVQEMVEQRARQPRSRGTRQFGSKVRHDVSDVSVVNATIVNMTSRCSTFETGSIHH